MLIAEQRCPRFPYSCKVKLIKTENQTSQIIGKSVFESSVHTVSAYIIYAYIYIYPIIYVHMTYHNVVYMVFWRSYSETRLHTASEECNDNILCRYYIYLYETNGAIIIIIHNIYNNISLRR